MLYNYIVPKRYAIKEMRGKRYEKSILRMDKQD